jgi:histidinol-phosphate aminotransferase
MMNLDPILRENIKRLKPYHSAREEHQAGGYVYLDANENPFGRSLNRYPDPLQKKLKQVLSKQQGVATDNIYIGNGSDEIIDLLIRAFIEPARDNIIIPEPTYGMYEVAGHVQGAEVRRVGLNDEFQPDADAMLGQADTNSKLIFLCSPNNPTGNVFEEERMVEILKGFSGLVVVDEAYIDFARQESMIRLLDRFPNLVVMRTLSKAAGLAGIRLGYAFADPSVVQVLTKIKYPYNVNKLTQRMALRRINKNKQLKKVVRLIREERGEMAEFLNSLGFVEQVFPSNANFLLVKVKDPRELIEYMKRHGIIIRDRSNLKHCENAVRVTIGKPKENKQFMKVCQRYDQKFRNHGKR